MDDQYSEAVEATLVRSRAAVAFIAAGGTATMAVVLAIELPAWLAPLLAAGVACSALHALDGALRPRRVRVALDGAACIDGREGRLRHPCFVAPWLTVVRWRPAAAWFDRTVLVLPDMLPAEDFRRLRVLLRWR